MIKHPDTVWMTSKSYPPALFEGQKVALFDPGTLQGSVVKCPGTRKRESARGSLLDRTRSVVIPEPTACMNLCTGHVNFL